MFIGFDEKLRYQHRHVKTEKGVSLTGAQMDNLRELVMSAQEQELVPESKLGDYEITTVNNKITAGKTEVTVTVRMNEEVN